ncbi:hypothetical protein [Sinomonas humi]|uniref:Uncharacterized protein n=1 Tax=Sinomonas humi TaxID=1338436 RepID=A0A0B2AHU3_9MICC|nr:hypothetical protein [Sinomonas humi]KHL01391.1 hypothetical protein LK10_16040 [Sinomonas humi]
MLFAGQVRQVLFDGRELPGEPTAGPLHAVDFSGAVFADVEFSGYRLDNVLLPEGTRAVQHWTRGGRRALELLAYDQNPKARMLAGELRTPPAGTPFVRGRSD